MHKLIFKPLLILAMLMTACQGVEQNMENKLEETPYFDLKGMLDQQIALLNQLKPEVEVSASIGQETEKQTVQKDSSDWAEALKLFADTDINKPVLQGQYIVKDSTLTAEGLKATIYQAKDRDDAEIPYLKVFYKENSEHPSHIESMFREDNPLYSTYRNMRLRFEEVDGNLRLSEYESYGRQKMIFKDSVVYSTKGLLKYQ